MRVLSVIGMLMFVCSVSVLAADETGKSGIYSSSLYQKKTRPFCVYDHDTHNEENGLDDCAVCHHLYEGGKLIEGESSEDQYCSDCHGIKPTKENSVPLTKAYHLRCKSCHEENWKGPVLCGECHIKVNDNAQNDK